MGTIVLTVRKKQNIFSKALDFISAPLSQPRATISGLVTGDISRGARAVKAKREEISSAGSFSQRAKKAAGVVGTTVLTTGALASGVLATAGSAAGAAGTAARSVASYVGSSVGKKVTSAALSVGAVAALAPKTFKSFVSTPGAVSTLAATAINPVAGVIVGLEKGTSLIRTGIQNVLSGVDFQDVATIGGSAAALGGAAYLGNRLRKARESATGALTTLPVSIPEQVALPSSFSSVSSGGAGSIVGESSPVVAEDTPVATAPQVMPNIKITNKPKINIAIAR